MKRSIIFGSVTVLALLGCVGIIINKMIPPEEMKLLLTKGVVPTSLISGSSQNRGGLRNPSESSNAKPIKAKPIERTSEEMQELLAALPRLQEIPWQSSQIDAAFSNGSARACRLLPPETAIAPELSDRNDSDGKLLCQRTTAFLVGLTIDPRARKDLHRLSKSTIENYLAEHALAIQPEICRDQEGRFLLTGDVHAAFFAKSFSSITTQPEPMIVDAVKRFRVLGVLKPEDVGQGELLPRTVVLAFSYVRDRVASTGLAATTADDYELLFLHLLPPQPGSQLPELAVFSTKDGRTVFEELNLKNQTSSRAATAVTASIRFDNFKLMGVYPADPVVTSLKNQVRGSLGVEELRNHLEGRNGQQPVSMERLLDQIHQKTSPASVTSASR